ncbi:AAA family ATPase [Roseobacter sp.]|uniref:AAA family ATPase n=1 Tax=Roseobacter sp. TaxID=1907202 RepID=UPI002965D379|nr:AAA family ATPase [Roseobacter sp.]MDW3184002.1 AAA family ATPase [Roseobacter sp.]
MKRAVIVTGLPASGKTTIAREIAQRLGLEFFDKDDFLEDLYEREGVSSWDHRKKLSRLSDIAFQEAAAKSDSAVLVSHWRPIRGNVESGTPSDWLLGEYETLVEVCCLCSPEEALRRFLSRTRHPGHLDKQRDIKELTERLASWSKFFPLRVGRLLEVRTDTEVNLEVLAEGVRTALSPGG